VTSDNGPAVTSRNCVLDPRKNETLDVVTSKISVCWSECLFQLRGHECVVIDVFRLFIPGVLYF